jgi:hypothetical protein
LVTSWDYGVVRASFNGEALGEPIDAYSPEIDAKWAEFGPVDVGAKANILRLEAANRNPASEGYYAGIDALVLAPAK